MICLGEGRWFWKCLIVFTGVMSFGCFGLDALAATNLLTNPGAETGDTTGWTLVKPDGINNNWMVGTSAREGTYRFQSSYYSPSGSAASATGWVYMHQEIDLVEAGFSAAVLDGAPDVAVSTWAVESWGNGGYYSVKAELRDANHDVITSYDSGHTFIDNDGTWGEISNTFSDYGSGLRYIYFEQGGHDNLWWAGNYGTSFDSASVTLADTTNPAVDSLSPADDASEVAVNSNLVITFDEAVDVESGNVTIKKSADDSTVEAIDVTGDQVTGSGTTEIAVNPSQDLASETAYYVQIDATAFDDAGGNSYAGINDTTTWSFTAADADDPVVNTYAPADNSVDVETDANLILTFSEVVVVGSGNIMIKRGSDDSTVETIDVASAQVTGTGTTTITIDPAADFEKGASYYIQIEATAFDDNTGNGYAGISDAVSWTFAIEESTGVELPGNTEESGTFVSISEGEQDYKLLPLVKTEEGGVLGRASLKEDAISAVEPEEISLLSAKIPDKDQVKKVFVRVFGKTITLADDDDDFFYEVSLTAPKKGGRYPYTVTADYGIFTLSRRGQFVVGGKVKGAKKLIEESEDLFVDVYEREPNNHESVYWQERVERRDKTTTGELVGAMQWQKMYGIYSNRLPSTVRSLLVPGKGKDNG